MKKTVSAVILTLLLLCIGVIAHANPLPLVPGMTGTTQKPTEQGTKDTKSTEKKTTEPTTKQTAQPSTEQPKAEAPAVAGNSNAVSKLEERAKTWFANSEREESPVDKLAYAAESAGGDYLSKINGAKNALLSKAKAIGDYGADSYRAAVDTLFGWDYSMKKGA